MSSTKPLSTGPIEILPVVSADVPEATAALLNAFGRDSEFINMWYPKHDTTEGAAAVAARLKAWLDANTSHFVKAVDNSASPPRIIGLAIWSHTIDGKNTAPEELTAVEKDPQKIWGVLPDGQNEIKFVSQVWKSLVQPRRKAAKLAGPKGMMMLEMLGVRQDAQGKGAGVALVAWGTRMADELGIPAFVESTPIGRRTYEKSGFVGIHKMAWTVDEDLMAGRELADILVMERPLRQS